MPAANCFAELVIAENKTAALADAVAPPGHRRWSILRASNRSRPSWPPRCARDGRPFGVVGIYSRRKQEWTAEQFRLAEWLAAQCAHILETLRLQEELRRQATACASEERLRLMVEGVKDYAIFMLDERGRVSHMERGSTAFERLFGRGNLG